MCQHVPLRFSAVPLTLVVTSEVTEVTLHGRHLMLTQQQSLDIVNIKNTKFDELQKTMYKKKLSSNSLVLIIEYTFLNKALSDRDKSDILNSHILFVVVEIFLIFLHSYN